MSKSLEILKELSCDKDNVDKVLAYVHEYLSVEQNEEKWKKQVREEKSNIIKSIEESLGVPKATFLSLLKNIKKSEEKINDEIKEPLFILEKFKTNYDEKYGE